LESVVVDIILEYTASFFGVVWSIGLLISILELKDINPFKSIAGYANQVILAQSTANKSRALYVKKMKLWEQQRTNSLLAARKKEGVRFDNKSVDVSWERIELLRAELNRIKNFRASIDYDYGTPPHDEWGRNASDEDRIEEKLFILIEAAKQNGVPTVGPEPPKKPTGGPLDAISSTLTVIATLILLVYFYQHLYLWVTSMQDTSLLPQERSYHWWDIIVVIPEAIIAGFALMLVAFLLFISITIALYLVFAASSVLGATIAGIVGVFLVKIGSFLPTRKAFVLWIILDLLERTHAKLELHHLIR